MEFYARENRAETPYGPAAHTMDMAAPTRLSLLGTAATGSPAMDCGRRLSLRDFLDFLSGLVGKHIVDGKEPGHRQISECTLKISTPEPH